MSPPLRKVFFRLSIAAGNTLQIAGLAVACFCLFESRSTWAAWFAVAAMLCGWVLLSFCCHGIAHWLTGRLLGIGFAYYTVGGTGNPIGWPPGLRWIFEHLPFFGVQTGKSSMQRASPRAKAVMWSTGVTSSAVIPSVGALWAWRNNIPGSRLVFLVAVFWAIGTLASNWTSSNGDYAKARRALANS